MTRQQQLKQVVGMRLRQAREAAGYQVARDFCQRYQLPVGLYVAQEAGDVKIKLSDAQHYCQLLNISLRWLLVGEKN